MTRAGRDTELTRPILIAGADRSGTSLMFALLASHPDISMVRRTNMWRWFHGRYGDLARRKNLDRCLDELLRYPRIDQLEPDVQRIRSAFLAGPPTYGHLFSLFHEHRAEQLGRTRWGDKSLHTEHHVDDILEDLPGARVIQMVRDPRDRYASVLRRYDDRTKGIGAAMGRWMSSASAIARNERRHPDAVMTVRYETLAREPAATLRVVCDFVGVSYAQAMLRMEGAPDHGHVGGNSSFAPFAPGTISTRSIGRFREVLAPEELAFIQTMAGRRMRTFGYDLVPVPWPNTAATWVFRSRSLPVDAVRVAGWRVSDRIHRRTQTAPPERIAAPS